MSILILFQSFVVFDEIFYHQDEIKKKGYVVIEKVDINVEKPPQTEAENNIDLESIFKTADIQKGIKISRQCSACHDFSNNLKIKVGPPLWGIVGRQAAIIADYEYSDALKKFNKNWTKEELYNFLEKPKEYIKGTKMIYKGLLKPGDRANLISYLNSLN